MQYAVLMMYIHMGQMTAAVVLPCFSLPWCTTLLGLAELDNGVKIYISKLHQEAQHMLLAMIQLSRPELSYYSW